MDNCPLAQHSGHDQELDLLQYLMNDTFLPQHDASYRADCMMNSYGFSPLIRPDIMLEQNIIGPWEERFVFSFVQQDLLCVVALVHCMLIWMRSF